MDSPDPSWGYGRISGQQWQNSIQCQLIGQIPWTSHTLGASSLCVLLFSFTYYTLAKATKM